MSRQISPTSKHLAFLGYKLGYNLVWLHVLCWSLWQAADDGDPLPAFLHGIVEEILYAVERLSALLPGRNATGLKQTASRALDRAWNAFKKCWQGDLHRGSIRTRDRFEPHYTYDIMLRHFPLTGVVRKRLDDAVARLRQALPLPIRSVVMLGSSLGAVFTLVPGTEGVGPVIALQDLLCDLVGQEQILNGLDIDFSREKYAADACSYRFEYDYITWAQQKASSLHQNIVQRYTASHPAPEAPDPVTWMPSREAADLSEKLGSPLSMSQISKLAKKEPCPFGWRKPVKSRLDVDVASFAKYVLSRRTASRDDTEPSSDDPSIQARIEEAQRKKQEGRQED
jgi:hypothetical protein